MIIRIYFRERSIRERERERERERDNTLTCCIKHGRFSFL
jgi:hypothetical protein